MLKNNTNNFMTAAEFGEGHLDWKFFLVGLDQKLYQKFLGWPNFKGIYQLSFKFK